MKVVFDHCAFSLQDYGGISRYIVNLHKELLRLGINSSISLALSNNVYLQEIDHHALRISIGKRKRYNYFLNEVAQLFHPNHFSADIIHSTYYGFLRKTSNQKKVITVYDMIHEKFGSGFDDYVAKLKQSAISKSDHIICISQSTKRDLLDYYPKINEEKVHVIYLASFNNKPITHSLNDKSKFILYVGERRGYKNFKCLVKAFANSRKLQENFKVICFGGGPFSNEEVEYFMELEILDKFIHKTDNDSKIEDLYKSASCFVHTSHYEGFGLPLLESFSFGCPVFAANNSSIPEVVDDAAILFNSEDHEDLLDKLEEFLFFKNDILLENITKGIKVNNRFSWEKNARETLDIYRQALEDG